jgi:pSer/pThr/pTyr-binding forkhead associated (FHA) protein
MRKLTAGCDSHSTPLTASTAPIEVTLRSVDLLDELDERTIVIQPSEAIPIGRSSKNTSKRLLPAVDNAYIDSPVISRDHAELTANAPLGVPTVYITDKGAMHGTHINGVKMDKDSTSRLNDGDTLQFGVDVVRDQGNAHRERLRSPALCDMPTIETHADLGFAAPETFIAKKYRFSSRQADPEPESLFPRGVSVPSALSSDDESEVEEVEEESFMRTSPRVPNYGSQYNPVNVDDFGDDELEVDTHNEIVDLVGDEDDDNGPPPAYATPKRTESVLEQERPTPGSATLPRLNTSELPPPAPVSELEFSDQMEDDAESIDDSNASADNQNMDFMSENESVDYSEMDVSSESEDSVASENEGYYEEADVVRRAKLGAMVSHAQTKATEATPAQLPSPANAAFKPSSPLNAGPSLPESARYFMDPAPPLPFVSRLLAQTDESDRYKAPETEPMPVMSEDYNPWMTDAAVPPRPSAPVPRTMGMWCCSASSMGYNTAPSLMRPTQDSWLDEQASNPFTMPFNDYRNDSLPPFDRVFAPSAPPAVYTENSFETPTKPDRAYENQHGADATAAMGVPTPPMASPEDTSSITPQQTPRTKVSIAEIVEDLPQDLPQQPLTPASITTPPSKKRKADALEADEEEKAEEEPTVVAEKADKATEVASVVANRPKKRLRRALHLAGTAAIGAAAVVGSLMYLPHGFFEYLD